MATSGAQRIVLSGLRGRDGSTTSEGVEPEAGGIPPHKCREAVNVDFDQAAFARKRSGSSDMNLDFSNGNTFLGTIRSQFKGAGGTLYAVDSTGIFAYLAPGNTQWVQITVSDPILNPTSARVRFAQTRTGLLYCAYPNAENRLHVWNGTTLRRAGMGVPNAPTGADTGSGSYAATLRYYRVRMFNRVLGVDFRKGEASASYAFTPSGSGAAVRITIPTVVDDATHWYVEVSLDNAVWYLLSGYMLTSTTTYDDSAATTTYSTNDAAPLAGRFTNWTAVDYLTEDDNRLIGATTGSRIYFSPVRGTTSDSFLDEEFVPDTVEQQNWVDVDANGVQLNGITPPFQGALWFHKLNAIGKLVPTHIDTAPYRVEWVFKDIYVGALNQESIIMGLDEHGNQAQYWLSQSGPYRYGANGIQYLGDDIIDLWQESRAVTPTVLTPPHGVYYGAKQQVWWLIPTNSSSVYPDLAIIFHVRLGRPQGPGAVRDGWATFTGLIGVCSTLYVANGVASTSADFVPYIGGPNAALTGPRLRRYGSTADTDAGTEFQAYVTLPARHFVGMERLQRVVGAAVLGTVGDHTLTLTLTPDYGAADAVTVEADMTAAGTETRTRTVFDNAIMDDYASAVTVQLGDAQATSDPWTIDELILRVEPGAELVP